MFRASGEFPKHEKKTLIRAKGKKQQVPCNSDIDRVYFPVACSGEQFSGPQCDNGNDMSGDFIRWGTPVFQFEEKKGYLSKGTPNVSKTSRKLHKSKV